MIFGRDTEFRALDTAFAAMLDGRGSVLFITGEAGLGKTTVVHEWISDVRSKISDVNTAPGSNSQSEIFNRQSEIYHRQSAIFVEAACSVPIGNVDLGRLEALQPWIDIVAQLEAVERSRDTRKSSLRNIDFKKLVHDAAPAWALALPFIGEIAHASAETYRLVKEQQRGDEFNPRAQNQQQVFQQYVNLISAVARVQPLVIFLDDLHWADASSLNLLFHLTRQIAGMRILVIGTYRHDDAAMARNGEGHPILSVKHEILRYSNGKEIRLSYLNRASIQSILSASFPTYRPDSVFELWLENISDGNPLFVTQFIATLREDGHLAEDGTFTGEYDSITVPPSALAVVEERTRRLDDATRELLMYAAIEGEEFTMYVLEHLTRREPMDLLMNLQRAIRHGLIVDKGTTRLQSNTPTQSFRFLHALFQKTLYDQLIDAQKVHLHRECHRLLKDEWDRASASADRPNALATKLLLHAHKCEEWNTVAEVALASAAALWGSFAEGEAMEMIGTCIRAAVEAGDGATHAEALFLRGKIEKLRGRWEDACQSFEEAGQRFGRAGNAVRAIDATIQQAWVRFRQSRYQETLSFARHALERAERIAYDHGRGAALNAIGNAHDARGEYDLAREHLTRSLDIQESSGDQRGQAASLNNIGNVHRALGAYDTAMEFYTRSLDIRERIGDRQGEAATLNNIGMIHEFLGEHERALECHRRSLAIKEAMGDRQGQALSMMNIGAVRHALADDEGAMEKYARCLELFESIGDRRGEALTLMEIGTVHSNRGRIDPALAHYARAWEIFVATANRAGEAALLARRGETHRRMGDFAQARSDLEDGLSRARELKLRDIEAAALSELALVCAAEAASLPAAGRTEKLRAAEEMLGSGIAIFRELKRKKEIDMYSPALQRIRDQRE